MNKCKDCVAKYTNERGTQLCKLDSKVVNAYGCEKELPKLELVAEGKVKDVGNPTFGIYNSNNMLVSVDIGDYNKKNIKIYVEVINDK